MAKKAFSCKLSENTLAELAKCQEAYKTATGVPWSQADIVTVAIAKLVESKVAFNDH